MPGYRPILPCLGLLLVLISPVTRHGIAVAAESAAEEDRSLTASATGRINHAGFRNRSHCTGFVVSGGHVVTAAHCLPGWEGESVHFLRGYDRGDLIAHISAPRAAWQTVQGRDIAFLCNADRGSPSFDFATGPVRPGDRLDIPGYAIPRAHLLQHHRCQVWKLDSDGGLRVACPVRPGTSGAPVLVPSPDGDRVVGVMSASSLTAARADMLTGTMLASCAVP